MLFKLIVPLLLSGILIAQTADSVNLSDLSPYSNKVVVPDESYNQVIENIKRGRYKHLIQNIPTDSCRTYLLDQFEHQVFPHWVGTKWDYNGYTNTPGPDKIIACGYFVSTTLKHMGFKWNRFNLAKMYSLQIVEKTCSDIQKYTDKREMIHAVLNKPDNLYIVGLDSHVGFILKRDKAVWFVHSNYYGSVGPEKEIAVLSDALESSSTYYIGTFFNESNIEKWLKGEVYGI